MPWSSERCFHTDLLVQDHTLSFYYTYLLFLLNANIHSAIKYCLNGFFQLAMKETSSKFETDENVQYPENLLKNSSRQEAKFIKTGHRPKQY